MFDSFSLGQSGCFLTLEYGINAVRVRKESRESPRDPITLRLAEEYLKHLRIQERGLMRPISVPQILESFSDGGYTMAFSPGLPLGVALNTMSRSDCLKVAQKLGEFFENSLRSSSPELTINPALYSKLDALLEYYESTADSQLSFLGTRCIAVLREFFSDTPVGTSFNHGDFSFENLLVTRGAKSLTALDFLESPIESVLVDVGRLWLDLSCGWWAEGLKSTPTAVLNAREIAGKLEPILRSFEIDRPQLDIWACFAALRISPYTRNPARLALLKLSLARTAEVYS